MPVKNLQEYPREDFATLLAAQEIDATGALFQAGAMLAPNTTHRTILIGLGGTGIQTLDYVKGIISSRLMPDWRSYIGFLGIDADSGEIDRAKYLLREETVLTTKPGVNDRKQNPAAYPSAWRRFGDPAKLPKIEDMNSPGSGRKRLIGRLKVHDKDPVSAVDVDIVSKLAGLKANVLTATTGQSNYEVYVFGSVCGGTCSGSFLEMPALIRRALNCNNLHIYAMLYLPDTLTGLDPSNASALMANGYASLKELNYYQGISMRKGYSEKWGYNESAAPELEIRSDQMFFDVPYLIGTPSGAAADSNERARQNIAEFMISLLTKVTVSGNTPFLTDAFLSNVIPKRSERATMQGVSEREADGTSHEFPRHFGSVGFAQIATPKKIVRSYILGNACKKAGLVPVDPDTRNKMNAANGAALLPFRGEDDPFNATEGTKKAQELLQPITDVISALHNAQFSFINASRWPSDDLWKRIHRREFEQPVEQGRINNAFAAVTNTTALDALETSLRNAFTSFKANVQEFVRAEGPLAFYTLYFGRFKEVNGNHGKGLGEMLKNLRSGKQPTGTPIPWDTVDTTKAALERAQRALDNADGLLDRISKQASTAAAWVTAFDHWMASRIVEKRREHVLGETGKLNDLVINPAALLAEQLRGFGYALSTLTGIYSNHGKSLDDYAEFSSARDNKAEINLGAVSPYSHQWLQQQAQTQIANANSLALRNALVDDFFANEKRWLEIPENSVVERDGKPQLAKNGTAVPARECFDRIMQQQIPDGMALSIESTFQAISANGLSYVGFANSIIDQLAIASSIMINTDGIPESEFHRYLMYPDTLNNSTEGTNIATAIQNAAMARFPGIQAYASADTDTIRLYQMAAPFEIYHLSDLKNWEDNYQASFEFQLHGMSPDVQMEATPGQVTRYIEGIPWREYPSLLRYGTTDPKLPDPVTGLVSREGEIRIKLAALVNRAKELGVLYSKKETNGWRIYRLNCNRSVDWTLDISIMQPNSLGLLPTGRALAEAIVGQNNRTIAELSAPVELAEQGENGLFGIAHRDEAFAWQWVERTLRVHIPMQVEVRNTVKKFEEWYGIIKEYNDNILAGLRPAKLIFIIRSGLLKLDDGMWKLTAANGSEKTIARLDAQGVKMLKRTNPKAARLVEAGFSAYRLFNAMEKQVDFDECYNRAREKLNDMIDQGEDDLIMTYDRMSEFIAEEAEALVDMGANLPEAETREPRSKLVDALKAKGISDIETIKDILKFYYRASLWEEL